MKSELYIEIYKALNEDLNMVLSNDDFEQPEIDLGVHISNLQKNVLSDNILKKCEAQDARGLKELINNCWNGQTPIFFATDDNIKTVIEFSIEVLGEDANLNWIDTFNVSDMSWLFEYSDFNGDISGWNVSNVTNISYMFVSSVFNGDISGWDVSSVTDMEGMFENSKFNGDISGWDVSNVTNMSYMFRQSQFNGDISKWDVSNVQNMFGMFKYGKFNQDISSWNISPLCRVEEMFFGR